MAKSKFDLVFCEHCGKIKKMAILSQIEGSETRFWHRCTSCKHSFIVDRSTLKKQIAKKELTKEFCVEYSPEKQFEIGTHIHHADLDDVGTITAKDKTTSGDKLIVVNFQKSGIKKLIELLKPEE